MWRCASDLLRCQKCTTVRKEHTPHTIYQHANSARPANTCAQTHKHKTTDLRNDVEVGDQGALEDDGNVRRVEELDWVGAVLAPVACALDGEIDPKPLKVYDHAKHEHGGAQVHQVGKVAAVEGLAQAADLVRPRGQQVKESDDGPLKLGPTARVDGGRAERPPDDRLADVCGDEEGDARAKTVALL